MKKGDTKRKFVHEFAILFVLVVSVGILFFYSSVNFTGLAVLNQYTDQTSCETAGYTWEIFTEENCTNISGCVQCETGCVTGVLCADGCQIDCTNISGCVQCETGCVTGVLCADGCLESCQECADIVTGGQCTGDVCDSSHLNLCLDETGCTGATGYWYSDACNAVAQCTPNTCGGLGYTCEIWGDGCGGTVDCGTCDTGYICSSGTCQSDGTISEESSESEESDSAGGSSGGSQITVASIKAKTACASDWECGEWQECIAGNQIRVCTDINKCNSEEGIPATSQTCVVPVVETCSDKIKNQDETQIDCGGSKCKKCGFITIVGSSISGAINASTDFVFKGMFGNVTKSIISISVLVFIIGGFVAGFFLIKKGKGKSFFDKVKGMLLKKNSKVKSSSDNEEEIDLSKVDTY